MLGEPGNFTRTANRRDLAVSPFAPTVLDKLNEAGIDTYAVGKINDIFNGAGINHDMGHNKSNSHGIDTLLKQWALLSLKKDSHSQTWWTLMPFTVTAVIHMVTVIACMSLMNACLKLSQL